jgi:RNA polymerase sigma-70 factor (ECF subfamily)
VESSKDSKLSRAEDSILIERIKQGDLSAFDELIARYEKQVYSFAYRMAQNYDDANDIASEAFIKVFQAINKFRGDSNFSTWVFRIVTNTYLDKKKRSKAHLNVAIDEYVELNESSVAKQFEDPAPDPLEMMEESERKDIILDAINQLPDYQRIIIDLFHLQGLSYEEIAEVVSLPIGTVKSRLNRARLVLRDILERNRELFNV